MTRKCDVQFPFYRMCVELVGATAANGDENRVNCGDVLLWCAVPGMMNGLKIHCWKNTLSGRRLSLFRPRNKSPLAFLSLLATGCWFFPLWLSVFVLAAAAAALLSFSGVI
jgi:hypothetical protein